MWTSASLTKPTSNAHQGFSLQLMPSQVQGLYDACRTRIASREFNAFSSDYMYFLPSRLAALFLHIYYESRLIVHTSL